MNVRHQVFVSSTYQDLVDERREVIQALLELDCIPAGMEMFPAANEDQWDLIRSVIDSSDYYVVIVGGRYGSQTAEGISFTEMEYDYAVQQGIPIAGFVHEDPDQIPRGKSEIEPAAAAKLEAFRAKVMTRMVKQYASPEALGSVVSRSLVALMKKHPRPGWVRGEHALTDAVRAEISELRAKLAEAERSSAVAAAVHAELDASLAQGEDKFELGYTLVPNNWTDDRRWDRTFRTTWDEVFGAIGPKLLDEMSNEMLRSRLGDWVFNRLSALPMQKSELNLYVDQESWDSVIVQLRALGLIEISAKSRPVKDTQTYWTLTRVGDEHLVKARAARRTDS